MEEAEQEARRLKSVAEAKYRDSDLKLALKYAKRAERLSPKLDGISAMVTALKILRTSASVSQTCPNPNWYKILQVEPFAHTNSIKKNYKKLAFLLHPDKNQHAGSEDAFKLVNEAFRFLSDKLRRKEYDMKLRIKIQDEKIKESGVGGMGSDSSVAAERESPETFWTACSTCRLLHQFERRYLGNNLVCPSCRKSFKALEVESGRDNRGGGGENGKVRSNERLRNTKGKTGSEQGRANGGGMPLGRGQREVFRSSSPSPSSISGSSSSCIGSDSGDVDRQVGGWRLRRRMSSVGEVMERSKPKKAKTANHSDEMMTLAEMRSAMKKKKAQEENVTMKSKKLKNNKDEREKKDERERRLRRNDLNKGKKNIKKIKDLGSRNKSYKTRGLAIEKCSSSRVREVSEPKSVDSGIIALEDSDFCNFDKDRSERNFKKGQVWAIYDDGDGMPRNYGLIDEVVSVNPFEVKISWLDLQTNGDEMLASWEKTRCHVPCGRFKVAKNTYINSVNIFSHVVDCERVAREIYCIYPKKGTVWALYDEAAFDAEGRNLAAKDKRCYDIVVFLTTYTEVHGLSMGYLEKVDGFKTVFKRKEIGSHAIRRLEKNDVRLVSHQIPARKLSGDEAPDFLKDNWELDPASLPSDLLRFG